MHISRRTASMALPLSLSLSLSFSVAALAQVASLVGPDETPAPEEAAAVLEFTDREEALLAFAQCMRDNGVDMDDPSGENGGRGFFRGGPGAGDVDFDPFSAEFQAAQATCGDILEASRPEIDPALQEERLEQQMQLAGCIRENGYPEYPDPAIGADGRLQRVGGLAFSDLGIDRRSEEFREVIGACRDELGLEGFGPGGRPGGVGPGGD